MKILNRRDGSTLLQETKVTDDHTARNAVYISFEMVDVVCNELQKLKSENEE